MGRSFGTGLARLRLTVAVTSVCLFWLGACGGDGSPEQTAETVGEAQAATTALPLPSVPTSAPPSNAPINQLAGDPARGAKILIGLVGQGSWPSGGVRFVFELIDSSGTVVYRDPAPPTDGLSASEFRLATGPWQAVAYYQLCDRSCAPGETSPLQEICRVAFTIPDLPFDRFRTLATLSLGILSYRPCQVPENSDLGVPGFDGGPQVYP